MKPKSLLVAGAVAALMLVLPASGSADWRKEGLLIMSEETMTFEGTARFESSLAEVECDGTTMTWRLEPGISSASITSITVDNPTANCTVSGLVGACGEHSVEDIHLREDATAEPYGEVLSGYGEAFVFSNVDMVTEFRKEEHKEDEEWCAMFDIFDNKTKTRMLAILDDDETIGSITLAGFLEDGEEPYFVGGTLNAQTPDTFGFE